MVFPFSLHCDCCNRCRPCPCAAASAPAALQFLFSDWGSYPAGYCSDCDDLNATLEVPHVADFTLPSSIGDTYDFTGAYPHCSSLLGPPGDGCLYEALEEFPCIPQACFTGCVAACGRECTVDADCTPANCGELYSCGPSDSQCLGYGGPCAVECLQVSVCVFNEEFDPLHEHGVCTTVGDCEPSVVAESCAPLTMRLRALLYVSAEGQAVLSVQVILFSRTATGEATATQLGGAYAFDAAELDCGLLDVDVPLMPVAGYEQPPVPACGPATTVRIVSLP